jgi:hypothetical protein
LAGLPGQRHEFATARQSDFKENRKPCTGGRRLGIEQVQQLLSGLALSLIVSACTLPADRETRAYNTCLARHAQEAAVCEGPRQAYEVDASDIPARAIASRPAAGYLSEGGLAGAGPPLKPTPLHPD